MIMIVIIIIVVVVIIVIIVIAIVIAIIIMVIIIIIIIRALPCGICCRLVLHAAESVIVAVHHHAVSVQLITHQSAD